MKNLPLPYFALMAAAGAGFAFAVRGRPDLQSGALSPLVWLIGLALLYEGAQALVPLLRLPPILPMQRFAGYFIGAALYLGLTRFLT